jgi:hypothetical protein
MSTPWGFFFTLDMISASNQELNKKTKQANKATTYFHKLGKVNETRVVKGGDSPCCFWIVFPNGRNSTWQPSQ